jgi:ATP-dependent 26S proteasome regulatory subunit
MYVIGDNIVIRINSNISNERKIEGIDVATNRDDVETIGKLIESSLVIKESLNDENSYKIAYKGQYSIETTVCKFNDWETNLKKNYNDDLPYDAMNDVIRSDKAGLIMFYGIPGTGKTSLVKTLINDNRDTDFIFVDTSVCESISDGLFLDFLQEHKNSVIVFEDCEKLLFSRDEMVNESIGTILNLTDGIIAESMKIKFICTFNCDLAKVDKALLRKGRLSIGYEFKKLSLEKTKAIYPDAKEEMTLADAHNASVNNGYEEKKRKAIGFH